MFCSFETSDQFVVSRSSFLSRPHWPPLLVLLEPKRPFVGTLSFISFLTPVGDNVWVVSFGVTLPLPKIQIEMVAAVTDTHFLCMYVVPHFDFFC